MRPSLGNLHHFILQHIVDHQYQPDTANIADHFGLSIKQTSDMLIELAEYHGVVLHPNSDKIWIIHPFSLAPTTFTIKTMSPNGDQRIWWGTCAWCSFGAAHLIGENVTIETRVGATGKLVVLQVIDGQLQNANELLVHFPIKMIEAWDNVVYTCQVMLLFEKESQIDEWCKMHGIEKGDVQPASKIYEFAGEWYGKHLDREWVKWSTEEAAEIFRKYDLTSDIWSIPLGEERF